MPDIAPPLAAPPTTSQGSTLRLVIPRPHPAQAKIIAESKRFNVLDCGARFGKTTLGIDRIIPDALKGRPTAWFAPTYKLLAEPWREMQSHNWLAPVIKHRDVNEHRLELMGGGSIDFWTLEDASENTARGRKYAMAVIDEAAGVKDLVSIWQRLIRTRLSDYRGGAWFFSTPRGMNDFKVLYDYGQDPNRPEWMSWKMPTSANPFIHADEIASARQDLTEARFSQEYLAEFINWEGSVFRKIQEAVTPNCFRPGPEPGHQYVIGVDWGKSIDFTVFVVLDITTGSVVAIDRSNQVDYSLQRGRLKVLRDLWHPLQITAEINSIGQPIIEQLEKDGVRVTPFLTSNATKTEAVEALALAFERSTIHIPDDAMLVSELEAFTGTVLPSGMVRYSAPIGQHDDIAMALIMAWHGGYAGVKVLGLVDYMNQIGMSGITLEGAMEKIKNDQKEMEMQKIKSSSLAKPATSDSTVCCAVCQSTCIVKIGNITKCNSCGNQEFKGDLLKQPTRADWLSKAS